MFSLREQIKGTFSLILPFSLPGFTIQEVSLIGAQLCVSATKAGQGQRKPEESGLATASGGRTINRNEQSIFSSIAYSVTRRNHIGVTATRAFIMKISRWLKAARQCPASARTSGPRSGRCAPRSRRRDRWPPASVRWSAQSPTRPRLRSQCA